MRDVAEIRLPKGDAAAKWCQPFVRMSDGIRILVQSENIRASLQDRLAMSAAAASAIDHERARPGREQFHDLRGHDRTVISEILHFVRLLFNDERTRREPDRTFK